MIPTFLLKKLQSRHVFLDILNSRSAEVSRAFHVLESYVVVIFYCLKSENFSHISSLITILLVVAYPGTELCACGL